jgi:hypothetical protein
MIIIYVSSFTFTGSLQIHIPLVQGIVDGPIANPSILHDPRLLPFQEAVGQEGLASPLRAGYGCDG